jgi:DNA-binding CsgD family transcriptional regulator
METKATSRNVVSRLDSALTLVRHDRWQLAAVGHDHLLVLANGPRANPNVPARAVRRVVGITPLANRCLAERRTVVVSTLAVTAQLNGEEEDWERDWATLLYAPVHQGRRRPVGLLTIGCRDAHWYEDVDIDYVSSLASNLVDYVEQAADPVRRLTRSERIVARLLAAGCSADEVANALSVPLDEAEATIAAILKKLRLRSPADLRPLIERPAADADAEPD